MKGKGPSDSENPKKREKPDTKSVQNEMIPKKTREQRIYTPDEEEIIELISLFDADMMKNYTIEAGRELAGAIDTFHEALMINQAKLQDELQNIETTKDNIEKAAVAFQGDISKIPTEVINSTAFKKLNQQFVKFVAKLEPKNRDSEAVVVFEDITKNIMNTIYSFLPDQNRYKTVLDKMRSQGKDVLKREKIEYLQKRIANSKETEPSRNMVELFNVEPKKALESWQAKTQAALNSTELAAFLRRPELNKTKVGELLGDPDFAPKIEEKAKKAAWNGDTVLEKYMGTFSFEHREFIPALRELMGSFQLPGEAQKIDRILMAFAQQYYKQNSQQAVFQNADGPYTLAYSVIMLNTDAHNPQVERKMSLNEFIKNNRGINNGKDFDPSFLTQIYNDITQHEIKLKGERSDVNTRPNFNK